MYDLIKTTEECIMELKAIGIPIRDDKISSISPVPLGSNDHIGYCRVTPDGGFQIGIWEEMLASNIQLNILKGLICHELLHTCDGCMNHKGKFHRFSRKIDKHYDYGMMTDDDDYLHPERPVLTRLQCPKCKYICIYRNGETYKKIIKLADISENLLPRCPYCHTVMTFLHD